MHQHVTVIAFPFPQNKTNLKTTVLSAFRPGSASVCQVFLTCVHSRGAQSVSSVLPLNEEHPHSVSPASAACLCPPTAAGPGVQSLADGRRTAASRRSFWPSSADGTLRCGQTLRAAWVVCPCERTAPRPPSGSQGSRTLWRVLLR